MIKAVVCIIENMNREILLLLRNDPKVPGWGLPGGKLEEHENHISGIVREIWEKTGLFLSYPKFIGKDTSINGMDVDVYYMKWNEATLPEIKLNTEHSQYEWTKNWKKFNLAGKTLSFIKLYEKNILKNV